jgi:hypothetical protein
MRAVLLSAAAACAFGAMAAAQTDVLDPAVQKGSITMVGVYTNQDGMVRMTYGGDGQMDGLSPTGVYVRDTFTIDENNVFTVTAAADHPLCPSAVGKFQLSESEGVVTMTLIEDECELRGQNLNGGSWTKVEE